MLGGGVHLGTNMCYGEGAFRENVQTQMCKLENNSFSINSMEWINLTFIQYVNTMMQL